MMAEEKDSDQNNPDSDQNGENTATPATPLVQSTNETKIRIKSEDDSDEASSSCCVKSCVKKCTNSVPWLRLVLIFQGIFVIVINMVLPTLDITSDYIAAHKFFNP